MPHIIFLILFLCFYGCANPIAPTGGEKDETPPKIDTLLSSLFYQTGFEKNTISLTFNEFVRLENIGQQVVVSPPLDYRPNITIKKKTVRFNFDEREILKENATYTINFGNAVVDLTERNPAENLKFVFSTGDFIDSLSLKGKLIDAYSGIPIEDALLLLHDNLNDSTILTNRPFYFSKSNKEGEVSIENIKSDTFQLFALVDKNLNYRYDAGSEAIGFWNDLVLSSEIGKDSIFKIRVFSEKPALRILERNVKTYGVLKWNFNQLFDQPFEILDSKDIQIIPEIYQDSLFLWYLNHTSDSGSVILSIGPSYLDTIVFSIPPIEAYTPSLISPTTAYTISILPGKDLILDFNTPLALLDPDKIHFIKDSSTIDLPIPSINVRKLILQLPLEEGFNFKLIFEPGSVTNMFNQQNQDSIVLNIRGEQYKNYGNLELTVNGLDTTISYILELFPSENEPPVFRRFVSNQTYFKESFRGLNPGNYFLNIISDLNMNGKWDSGILKEKKQPEPILREEVKGLRANWEFDLVIEL
jgi:hypothetical protein